MNTKALIWLLVILIVILGGYFLLQGTPEETTPEPIVEEEPVTGVVTEDVTYFNNVTGYYARPAGEESYPGVVMIHEWWGLNENIKAMARELAGEGYAVLAVDLYNGQVAETREEAQEYRTGLDQIEATENLQAATDYLRSENAERIASLGWCFGGGQSLELALSGEELDATVIYYGSLVTDEPLLSDISWPVLGVFGEEDTSIPVADVEAFDDALTVLNVDHEIYVYPGVGHAFANPSGDNFAPEETADAWEKTLTFLERTLK